MPKLVVATQTRVLEAAVDEAGAWLPCTPVLSVVVPPPRLWHVAAAVLSPPATAWALQRCAGAALGPGAIKLGANDLRSLPLPEPGDAWDRAAAAVRRASAAPDEPARHAALLDAAEATTLAYGLDDPGLVAWWAGRLGAAPVP